jgi:hypothetical protein
MKRRRHSPKKDTYVKRIRPTNHTADVAKRQRLASSRPGAGREFGDTAGREVSETRQH